MNPALLLIDIQNDYFPGGAMELVNAQEAGKKAQALLNAFRAKALPIIHIQHLATRPGSTFFLPGTPGAEIHESVSPQIGEIVIEKNFPNSFLKTTLLEHLHTHKIERLVVGGMMTHMCVDTTVRAAFDHGFPCTLAFDACATRALSFGNVSVPAEQVQAAFMAALNGLFATLRSADEICTGMGA